MILMRQISLATNSAPALWDHPAPTKPSGMRMLRQQIKRGPHSEPRDAKS
jgi:hypothetical protein